MSLSLWVKKSPLNIFIGAHYSLLPIAIIYINFYFMLMHQSHLKKRTLKCHKFASDEIYPTKSESILLFVTNITALNKMILFNFTSYLPHSQSQAVPALPGQNSMPIG